MSDLTRALLTLLVLVLLLVGGRWAFFKSFEQRTRTVHTGMTGEARDNSYLAAQRCSVGQGFLFSKPLPVAELCVADLTSPWMSTPAPRSGRGLHVVE